MKVEEITLEDEYQNYSEVYYNELTNDKKYTTGEEQEKDSLSDKPPTKRIKKDEDHISAFLKSLEHEIRAVKDENVLRKLKLKLITLVLEAQES